MEKQTATRWRKAALSLENNRKSIKLLGSQEWGKNNQFRQDPPPRNRRRDKGRTKPVCPRKTRVSKSELRDGEPQSIGLPINI